MDGGAEPEPDLGSPRTPSSGAPVDQPGSIRVVDLVADPYPKVEARLGPLRGVVPGAGVADLVAVSFHAHGGVMVGSSEPQPGTDGDGTGLRFDGQEPDAVGPIRTDHVGPKVCFGKRPE